MWAWLRSGFLRLCNLRGKLSSSVAAFSTQKSSSSAFSVTRPLQRQTKTINTRTRMYIQHTFFHYIIQVILNTHTHPVLSWNRCSSRNSSTSRISVYFLKFFLLFLLYFRRFFTFNVASMADAHVAGKTPVAFLCKRALGLQLKINIPRTVIHVPRKRTLTRHVYWQRVWCVLLVVCVREHTLVEGDESHTRRCGTVRRDEGTCA